MDEEKRRYIAANYARLLNSEIAAIVGCHPSLVGRYLRAAGLRRTAEDIAYLRQRAIARWREACDNSDAHQRRRAKLRRLYKAERLRVLMGQPQQTAMRINIETTRQTRDRYNATRRERKKR